jgi:hypothetical protein
MTLVRVSFALAVAFCAAAAPAATDILLITGDSIPGTGGSVNGFIENPILNDAGQVAVHAALTGTAGGTYDDRAVVIASVGSVTKVLQENDPAPDANGELAGLFEPISFAGGYVFVSTDLRNTSGGSDDNWGLFMGAGGTVTQVVRAGEAAPSGDGVYNYPMTEPIPVNTALQAAFVASLSGTSGGGADDEVIIRASYASGAEIARKGQPVPDANGTYHFFYYDPVINAAGQVAFTADLADTSGGIYDDHGLFRGDGETVTKIARQGDLAGDGISVYDTFGNIRISETGTVLFTSTLTGTPGGSNDNHGLYVGNGDVLLEVVREGDAVPDGNGEYSSLSAVALLDSGQVVFHAWLRNTLAGTDDDDGIFRVSGGTTSVVVRSGQPAPGGDGTIVSVGSATPNQSGLVAFTASYDGNSGGDDADYAVCLTDGFELVELLCQGDAMAGSTVSTLQIASGGEASTNAVNEHGQVAVDVTLANGKHAVVLCTPDLHWRANGSGSWGADINWTLGLSPGAMYDVLIDPSGSATVNGSAVNMFANNLTVGSAGGGLATLRIDNGGDMTCGAEASIGLLGRIDLADGHALTATALNNAGVLAGSGTVGANLANLATGQVIVGDGEELTIVGTGHASAGQIDVAGGEIRFVGDLTNAASTGAIYGTNAVLRLQGGLDNYGALALAFGTNRVFGNILNGPTGFVVVSGASQATFYGDVTNAGTMEVSAGSTAVFFGDFSGNGVGGVGGTVLLEGDTRPGASPGVMAFGGDLGCGAGAVLEMELAGALSGLFDRITVAGLLNAGGTLKVILDGYDPERWDEFDLLDWGACVGTFGLDLPAVAEWLQWDTSDLYTTGAIAVTPALPGDANTDGIVDLQDFGALKDHYALSGMGWAEGDFNNDGVVDLQDFGILKDHYAMTYGDMSPGAVPEPGTIAMAVLATIIVARRRR